MASRLPNYLRTFRKRVYLSQDEVAFLLGANSGTRVSRYERFSREPGLQIALAYHFIFGESTEELFAGLYRQIAEGVRRRAETLGARIEARSPSSLVARHKLEAIRSIMRRAA